MDDFLAFLLARIAEDEEAAHKLLARTQQTRQMLKDHQIELLGRLVPGWHDWPDVEAQTTHVLADCEAKRLIVEDQRNWVGYSTDDSGNTFTVVLNRTLTLLALPHADHPDYREEWRL